MKSRIGLDLESSTEALRSHMVNNLEALRDVLENLRDVLAELAQRAPTTRATACLSTMRLDLTRQMVRPLAAETPIRESYLSFALWDRIEIPKAREH